jgi:hypothetical protein
MQKQLDELSKKRYEKLEEKTFNNISSIMHNNNPSLGYLSFDSIDIPMQI